MSYSSSWYVPLNGVFGVGFVAWCVSGVTADPKLPDFSRNERAFSSAPVFF